VSLFFQFVSLVPFLKVGAGAGASAGAGAGVEPPHATRYHPAHHLNHHSLSIPSTALCSIPAFVNKCLKSTNLLGSSICGELKNLINPFRGVC
jgi:hypothetical protein